MKYLLGIDSGGTLTKAALYDTNGNEIALAEEKFDIIFPDTGYNERDFNQFREENIHVIRRVIQKSGIDAKNIVGVAITGQGNGLYLFDENGRSVRNPVLSGDMRAKEYIKKWYADGTAKKVAEKTRQAMWAGQFAAVIAWFADHEPESLEKARYFVTCKEYIRYMLTGKFYMELAEASSTACVNLRTRSYDRELLELLGIEKYYDKLPPLIESSKEAGRVTKEAADLTGLAEGTPVMGGMFDIAACAIATGVTNEDTLSIVAGTWGINEYIDKREFGDENFFMCSIFCLEDYYLMTEASTTSAVNLEWFIDNFMQEEAKKAKETGGSVYDTVNSMVSGISPDQSDIIFLPFLFGTNVSQDAKGAFVGLDGIHTKAHLLRAVYEGVVFCHKYHIERLYQYKKDFQKIRISGGASKSKVWVQIFADVIGLPVEVSGKSELGTMGAAMCAGVGIGQYADMREAAEVFSDISEVFYPNPKNAAAYEKKYRLYKQVIEAMDGTWKGFKK